MGSKDKASASSINCDTAETAWNALARLYFNKGKSTERLTLNDGSTMTLSLVPLPIGDTLERQEQGLQHVMATIGTKTYGLFAKLSLYEYSGIIQGIIRLFCNQTGELSRKKAAEICRIFHETGPLKQIESGKLFVLQGTSEDLAIQEISVAIQTCKERLTNRRSKLQAA